MPDEEQEQELQAGATGAPEAEVETPEGETPEVEEAPEKITFDAAQQAVFNDAISKQAAKRQAAEATARTAQAELEEMRAQIPTPIVPEVPDLPDPDEDDFHARMLARDQVIEQRARHAAGLEAAATAQRVEAARQAQAGNDAFVAAVSTYSDRATKLGISAPELKEAGAIIAGLDGHVQAHILGDEQGPAMTMYLSRRPLELETLRGLDMMSAAVFLETKIKPPARASGVKVGDVPAPLEGVKGAGARRERGPPGSTFT